jgi:thiamine-monophosphate kinase
MKTLQQTGEHAALAALTAGLKAVGDDCAVLPLDAQYDLLLTSDPLIEGVHFEPGTPPGNIGHKAVARVLSDIAAMGGDPQYLLINLVARPEQSVEVLEQIYKGVRDLLNRFGVELAGGDLAQGPALELHVFGTGRVPKGKALLRSGAHAGDLLYVTGPLGGSLVSGRHLTFTPRLAEGKWLRQSGLVRAMMDISDGLATDLRHMLKASGTGADLASDALPKNGTVEQALYDGEDFELLFAVRAADADEFEFRCMEHPDFRFSRIGTLTGRPMEILLDGTPLTGKAFEHFKPVDS